jgi:hypothetical protein
MKRRILQANKPDSVSMLFVKDDRSFDWIIAANSLPGLNPLVGQFLPRAIESSNSHLRERFDTSNSITSRSIFLQFDLANFA